MKRMAFILVSLWLSSLCVTAQPANTQWTGKAGQMNIVWTFQKDITGAVTLPDSVSLGTMTFSVKDSVVSFRKIEGRLPRPIPIDRRDHV